jgi:hypothetical protein
MKHYKSEIKEDAKHQTKKPKEGTKSSGCISDDTKCPIHPYASHTWGECYANKDKKRPGQPKKNEVNSNAAHIGNNNVSIASNVTSLGAMDSISTALAPCCQKAVNDDRTVSTVTDRMFAQLCLDLNNKVNDPDALLEKFKAAHAVKATAEANNGMCMYNAFTSFITHHLHDL